MSAQSDGPPTLDNALINGTNIYEDGGHRYNVSFTAGSSYRIRLVNGAVDTHFKFMIDNHTMTVIASDLVPIQPYTTKVLDIGMGQRYDVSHNPQSAKVCNKKLSVYRLLLQPTKHLLQRTFGCVRFLSLPALVSTFSELNCSGDPLNDSRRRKCERYPRYRLLRFFALYTLFISLQLHGQLWR